MTQPPRLVPSGTNQTPAAPVPPVPLAAPVPLATRHDHESGPR
jgi:hypothetical protein